MIKIGVVDDERHERDTMSRYYEKLQKELKLKLDLHFFTSGEGFLEEYDGTYDLLCLDIDMKGRDGISTAKAVREKDEQVIIMFITNMAQMAIRGYEVRALDFVLKPMNYYSFAMKMRNAFHMIENKQCRNIVVPTSTGMQKISTNDLYYAEINGHYLYYHTVDGVFRQKSSMKELEDKLKGLSFERCNNCYLINLKYVECVDKDDLKIGGGWLRISRPRKKKFMEALADYMGGITV